jgi:DNA-binding response OmpR family regulator
MDSRLNIALVEDNDDLRELLNRDLTKQGYTAALATCAEDLDDLAVRTVFDVMILDINLPGEDGFSIARRFRHSNPNIYIVMLTARDDVSDKVLGYQSGADIYLSKPISSVELVAAIKGIERRIATENTQPSAVMNVKAMTLTGTKTVSISRIEVILIKALSESVSGNLPYFRLHELCGEGVNAKTKSALEVRFVRLRKKMAEAGLGENAIRAMRNEGYQLTTHIHVET